MNHSTSSWSARLLTVVLALTAPAAPVAYARADRNVTIESILARSVEGSTAATTALARQLVELGPQADEALFDALALECAESPVRAGARSSVLISAFEWMGPARWRPLLLAKAGAAPSLAVIGTILAIEGRSGSAEDVPFVLYTAGFDHDGVRHAELESAVTSILLRHEPAFDAVDRMISSIVPELRSSMIRSVEATKKPKAALLLARWIESRREMRIESLPYLSRLSLSLEKPLPPEVVVPVRALVENGDATTLGEAILCTGRLRDYDAIPALIKHLKEGDYGQRAESLWALRSITKLQFGKDPGEWSTWFEEESRWWNNDSRQAFMDLAHGSKARKVEVLRQVSILHAWRDRAATEISIALDDVDADIATLTAAELERLDSKLAVSALVDALFEGRPTVVEAVQSALKSITQRELPSDPVAVRELLVPVR